MKHFSVTKSIHFCYGHRLLNYDGKCKYLHGHNARVDIKMEKEACDARGMVVDFGDIKNVFVKWLDENVDHKMLLCKDDPLIETLQKNKQPIYIMDDNPTAESIAKLIFKIAKKQGFPVSEVHLWETPSSFASYTE